MLQLFWGLGLHQNSSSPVLQSWSKNYFVCFTKLHCEKLDSVSNLQGQLIIIYVFSSSYIFNKISYWTTPQQCGTAKTFTEIINTSIIISWLPLSSLSSPSIIIMVITTIIIRGGRGQPHVDVWLYGRIIHNFIPCPAGAHYPNDDDDKKLKLMFIIIFFLDEHSQWLVDIWLWSLFSAQSHRTVDN